MSDGYRVAVVGATGQVVTLMLQLLRERAFPASEVVPFASERSAGRAIEWGEEELEVRALSEDTIQGLDLVLSSAGGSVSAEWTPKLVAAGATVVDNTSYWRMHDDVPLVVSEVNPEALDDHSGIVGTCWTGALARLALARAGSLQSRISQGADADAARVRALADYKEFLTLWKNADPDIPILKGARAEYAKLH